MNDEQFHATMVSLRRQRVTNATAGLISLRLLNVDVGDYAEDLALACPSISNLIMRGGAIVPLLKFLLETNQKSITSNTNPEPFFPNFRTLLLAGSYEDDTLRALVLGRKAIGRPLIQLNCSVGAGHWYRQHVEIVETYSIL